MHPLAAHSILTGVLPPACLPSDVHDSLPGLSGWHSRMHVGCLFTRGPDTCRLCKKLIWYMLSASCARMPTCM
jgi:hypothetical protein